MVRLLSEHLTSKRPIDLSKYLIVLLSRMINDTHKYIWLWIICRHYWNSVFSLTNNGLVAPEKEGSWFHSLCSVLVQGHGTTRRLFWTVWRLNISSHVYNNLTVSERNHHMDFTYHSDICRSVYIFHTNFFTTVATHGHSPLYSRRPSPGL
jgi:hypothetical protein